MPAPLTTNDQLAQGDPPISAPQKDEDLAALEELVVDSDLVSLELLIGKFTNLIRQLPIIMPELRRRKMLQSGVQRPASQSSSARFPAASKRPATMSASICRSHWSAANSSNHSRKRANSSAERCETADSRSSTLMRRKLSTKLGIANLRCPAHALTLTSSLLKGTALLGFT